MRKEIIVAILLGVGVGLVVTFGIVTAKTALDQSQLASTPTPAAVADGEGGQKEELHYLTVSSPQNEGVVSAENLKVSGETTPLAIVAITTAESDFVVEADEQGKFSQEIVLEGGVNYIGIVSFSQKGEREETEISVVYSTADF